MNPNCLLPLYIFIQMWPTWSRDCSDNYWQYNSTSTQQKYKNYFHLPLQLWRILLHVYGGSPKYLHTWRFKVRTVSTLSLFKSISFLTWVSCMFCLFSKFQDKQRQQFSFCTASDLGLHIPTEQLQSSWKLRCVVLSSEEQADISDVKTQTLTFLWVVWTIKWNSKTTALCER